MGEYVELENLLPVSLSDSNMQNTRSRHIVMGQDGHLELQSNNVKKINDISTWSDAFITYCSIYLTAHSNCSQSKCSMYNWHQVCQRDWVGKTMTINSG